MRGKSGPKGIDWSAARKDYVTASYADDVTYADIAAKYGVCRSTVWKRGAAEGWKARRKAYREKTMQRQLDELSEQVAEAMAEEYFQVWCARRRDE